jgi:ribosomal protein L24
MPILKEGKYISDIVKYDVELYSRDTVTVVSGANKLEIGTVLGVNAAGKYVQCDPSATVTVSGDAVPAPHSVAQAVLLVDVDASSADIEAVALARHAVVADAELVFINGITNSQKLAAIKQLGDKGIVTREEV